MVRWRYCDMTIRRHGFTLVELIIVVLILGIIASIGVPKVINVSAAAREHAVVHSLEAVRDAIETYAIQHSGEFPGADGSVSTFKSDLKGYLRTFPTCTVGPLQCQNDSVKMQQTGAVAPDATPTMGWKYYYKRGVFIINNSWPTQTDPTVSYDEL